MDGATRTAAAYLEEAAPPRKHPAPRPNKDGESPPDKEPDAPRRRVTIQMMERPDVAKSSAPFVDQETGSRWDIAGRAVEGELKGWTLTWLDSVQVKWFAWAAEYPGTTIFQGP
jgi:hypothetical protein